MHLNYPDYSGVILDESQSGKTINVQRGFEVDRNKANQKEETEINSGDSSNIQKSRHSSSSSSSSSSSNTITETRRIQLNPTGEKPDVLTTTYTQNSSGTSSIGTDNLSSNRGVIFHTESGASSTSLGGGFRESEKESFGSRRLPDLEEPYETRINPSVRVESRWDESDNIQSGHTTSSGRFDPVLTDSERLHQEILKWQEETRLRQEEEARQKKLQEERLLIQRQREEQERTIALQRHREEERRREEEERRQEEERRRYENERREEEERRREEERRLQEEREHRYNYNEERHYGVFTNDHQTTESFITGDREETVGGREFGFRLHNMSSTQELERLFGSLTKDVDGYQLYRRQGQQYVWFMARFRTSADWKEYIEFKNGTMYPLQDRYGRQSYVSESTKPRDSRFYRVEAQLLITPDSKGYIVVLNDGRKFPLRDSSTYTEERRYTLHSPYDYQDSNTNNQNQKAYSQSWQEESSSDRSVTSEGSYETRYNTRTHEERQMEERISNTRIYGRDNRFNRDRLNDEFSTEKPDSDLVGPRHRRESDMISVQEFKKFERLHRHRRDLETEDFLSNEAAFQNEDYYENDPESQNQPVQSCDAAKCVMLRCVLGPLKKDQEVWIGARYRVDARTLKEVAFKEKVRVSTKLVARVTKQPFIGTPAEQVIKSDEVITNIEPSAPPSAPDIIPVWVVVLSACAGMIILLLLIYLLHKVSNAL